MDRRPALTALSAPPAARQSGDRSEPPAPAGGHGELLDQAVFTSLRSRVARGYRIVAASAGLSEDERRELVQRAPSHGNLLDSSAAAAACAGWLLRSGRYCLLSVGHDGPEPSGRGGLRVVT
ncbi:MAG: hypothetical protein AB1716_20665, partial [Planctomycetota bacterium]